MLSKKEIINLLNSKPYVSAQGMRLTSINHGKDGKITIPRGLLQSKILDPDKNYTLVFIQE